MKLRNKKTGRIQEIVVMPVIDGYPDEHELVDGETSLQEFNKVWEDCTPTDPLIKDEKIREIIRAWAEVNGVKELKYIADENSLQDIFRNSISFNRVLDLKDEYTYTTEELCGEEEE